MAAQQQLSQLPVIAMKDVEAHSAKEGSPGMWMVVDGWVLDVTKFAALHPGGARLIREWAGKDATERFYELHHPNVLQKYLPRLAIGRTSASVGSLPVSGAASASEDQAVSEIPFGDPYWYRREQQSPYYKPSHHEFRAKVRAFVDEHIAPFVHSWDEAGDYPPELHEKAYKAGLLATIWPQEFGGTPPKDFDVFHDLILVDELSRCGAGGILWAVFFSFGIALPPILSVGSKFLKDKVARDVITGKKIMSLAVTEPYAGSDVAGIQTTAVRDGDFYVINGEKKFITSGTKAHFYTVAVRTGGPGMKGVSLLLVEKGTPGLTVRRQKTQGWWTSNTAYMIFENVRVPASHLIGQENQGFIPIMNNFNHERFVFAAMSNRYARVCLEEAIRYGRVRKTFGKRLIDHQVIRHKIAHMAMRVESTHAMLEQVAYQINKNASARVIGGPIAMLKVMATQTMEFCAREASQILGGNSYVRGGQGEKVERLYREVRVNAIAGGSEEVLLDLAMKQARL